MSMCQSTVDVDSDSDGEPGFSNHLSLRAFDQLANGAEKLEISTGRTLLLAEMYMYSNVRSARWLFLLCSLGTPFIA
jgi:hypothetical protein